MTATMHVLTGPPGAGKTAVLEALRPEIDVCDEPARAVLAHQRAIGGRGTGEQDAELFVSLMLERTVRDCKRHAASGAPVLFDRGLPDLLGFARHYGLKTDDIERYCHRFRYNSRVFWFPHWPDIYVQDAERRATADEADRFGDLLKQSYQDLGYTMIDVPKQPVSARAAFVNAELAR